MSLASRTGLAIALGVTVLAMAPSVMSPSVVADEDPPPVTAAPEALGAAGVDGLASATRGTMVQIAPLPETPTTVAGDSLIVPENSGTGRRVVYSKGIQRVWLINEYNLIDKTHRVSGRPDAPPLGTFTVFSRSPVTCAMRHSDICMRWMVRFARKGNDNIGFHEIPRRNGVPLQTNDQLGLALSGGCVRQSTEDSLFMWDWAHIGTVVVVVP